LVKKELAPFFFNQVEKNCLFARVFPPLRLLQVFNFCIFDFALKTDWLVVFFAFDVMDWKNYFSFGLTSQLKAAPLNVLCIIKHIIIGFTEIERVF